MWCQHWQWLQKKACHRSSKIFPLHPGKLPFIHTRRSLISLQLIDTHQKTIHHHNPVKYTAETPHKTHQISSKRSEPHWELKNKQGYLIPESLKEEPNRLYDIKTASPFFLFFFWPMSSMSSLSHWICDKILQEIDKKWKTNKKQQTNCNLIYKQMTLKNWFFERITSLNFSTLKITLNQSEKFFTELTLKVTEASFCDESAH